MLRWSPIVSSQNRLPSRLSRTPCSRVVEGEVGELVGVVVGHLRGDQVAVEAGVGRSERGADRQAEPKAVADAVRVGPQRKRVGKPRLAGQLAGRQHSGQFRQRQRASPRLRHQCSTDLSADRHACPLSEQSTRGRRIEAAQDQLGKPIAVKCAYVTLAGTENERHPVGQQPSGHEQQRLSRGRVQPLSIIHHGDDRAFLRGLTQQAQRRHEDGEPVRGGAVLLAERSAQRPRLRRGQPVQVRQHGAQQPVQCRERQRRLRLNALRPQHLRARRAR